MLSTDASRTAAPTQNRTSAAYDARELKIIQHQVGHSWAWTTAGYTSVGADHANRMLRAALDRAFTGTTGGGTGR
jgi:hypothetical protein